MTAAVGNLILEAALSYAARGWHVFPCDPDTKRPLLPKETSKGARDGGLWLATTDPVQIATWWRRWPKAMIGVRMGTGSGALAFDVDCYKTDPTTGELRSFEDWIAAVEETIGAKLPPTLVSETPRGGRHLLYAPPEGIALADLGNSRGALPGVVDVRGDGGYIIVGPSVRMGAKAREEGCEGRAYFWLDPDAPIATGPVELFDCIRRVGKFARVAPAERPAGTRAPIGPAMGAEDEAVRKYALAALDNAVRAVAGAGPGTRNETINKVALGIGHLVGAGALGRGMAHAALYDAALGWGIDGGDKALKPGGTLDRALDDGAREPADLSEVRRSASERAERRARWEARVTQSVRAPEPPAWMPEDVGDREDATPQPPSAEEGETGDGADDVSSVDMKVIEACAGYDHSDTDNAHRLLAHYGADLRVRGQEGGREPIWCGWIGTHWEDVAGKAVATRIAQKIGGLIKLEALHLQMTPDERMAVQRANKAKKIAPDDRSDDDMEAIAKGLVAEKNFEKRKGNRISFGTSSKNKARVEAMLAMAAPHLLTDPEAFNADPLVLATRTHTLVFRRERVPESGDVSATVQAVEGHRKADLITRMVPVDWRPATPAPRWRAMLERFQPDETQRRFLQIAAGIGVLGLTEQVLVFHYGSGANSKSVFLECISRTLGPLAAGLPAEAIAGDERGSGLKASPEIARLYGVRFVRIAEIPANEPLKEEFVKRITGGEKFPARNLFEGYFEFKPIFVPHMSGNGYPRIVGTDNGIWRRMRVVHWPVQLADDEIRNFDDVVGELMEEREGILAWLVEGARIYLEEGLVTPAAVHAETMKMREANDPVARFFDAAVVVTKDQLDRVSGGDMYSAYTAWANGDHVPVNKTRFGLNLTKVAEAKGVGKDKSSNGLVEYIGVRLKRTPTRGDPGWQPPEWADSQEGSG